MNLSGIRLLVDDFDACFNFYSEKLGLKATWGEPGEVYASFETGVSSGISLFKSDLMAEEVGNFGKKLPGDCREKVVIVIKVDDVDRSYEKLQKNGIRFITEPKDMKNWGMRVAHFRDPENNLIEIWMNLPEEKWENELKEEAQKYNKKN